MDHQRGGSEFEEFDTDGRAFDAQFAESEPTELVADRSVVDGDSFYESDEPIEKIRGIVGQPPDFVTAPTPGLNVIISRNRDHWRVAIIHDGTVVSYSADSGDDTFDEVCEVAARKLHQLGLNRERTAITDHSQGLVSATSTGSSTRTFVFRADVR